MDYSIQNSLFLTVGCEDGAAETVLLLLKQLSGLDAREALQDTTRTSLAYANIHVLEAVFQVYEKERVQLFRSDIQTHLNASNLEALRWIFTSGHVQHVDDYRIGFLEKVLNAKPSSTDAIKFYFETVSTAEQLHNLKQELQVSIEQLPHDTLQKTNQSLRFIAEVGFNIQEPSKYSIREILKLLEERTFTAATAMLTCRRLHLPIEAWTPLIHEPAFQKACDAQLIQSTDQLAQFLERSRQMPQPRTNRL